MSTEEEEDDNGQWALALLEREEYEAWLQSLKPKNLDEHLTKLKEEQDEHQRNLPKRKIS